MGLSYGTQSSNTNSSTSSSGSTANTYSPGQTAIQNQVGSNLSSDLAAAATGQLTPGTVAQETAANDQVNKTSAGSLDRVTQFLASRGLGSSGLTGKAGLQSELNRESTIGSNAAAFAGQQNSLNQGNLLAALNYAFTQLGSTTGASSASSGSSSGSQFGADVSAAVGGTF